MSTEKKAAFIIIGNEILNGRTQDQNLNFLANKLNLIGIDLVESAIIRDDENSIISKVNEFKVKYDYVFTSGGIGPTHDDITAESISKALNRKYIQNQDAVKILAKHYSKEQLNEARLKMSYMPEGSILLNNPVSSAPGFLIENIFVFAGVPKIMQAMTIAAQDHLIPGKIAKVKTVNSFVTEGSIAKLLTDLQNQFSEIEIGSYPFIKDSKLGTAIVFRGYDDKKIDKAILQYEEFLKSHNYQIF